MNKSNISNTDFITDIGDLLIRNSDGFYEIDLLTEEYRTLKSTPALKTLLPRTGNYLSFFRILFLGQNNPMDLESGDAGDANSFPPFLKTLSAKNEVYTRRVQLNLEDHLCKMNLILFSGNSSEAYVSLSKVGKTYLGENKDKANVLSQTYLYSMLVDLDLNECFNPVVTEFSTPENDQVQIHYSTWRDTLKGAFPEEFLPVFLEKTDPSYVRTQLEMEKRYSFSLQMRVLSGQVLWTQHSVIRVRNEENDHLTFLYTVQDADQEKTQLLQQLHMHTYQQSAEEEETSSGQNPDSKPVRISPISNLILDQIEQELRSNYQNKLTLNKMAEKYYINPAYLGQLFIRKYGMSFHEYLTCKRMETAAFLLTHTDHSIRHIIELVGISSTHYFNRLFKEYYKCTPTEYKQKNRT